MSRIRIRPALPGDAPAYVETHVAAQIAAYDHLMPPEYARDRLADIPRTTADLTAELERREAGQAAGDEGRTRLHWVAEVADTIVGIACAGEGPDWWEADFDPTPPDIRWTLSRLYVLPEAHGSGAGQALFEAAVGDRSSYLWILRDNPRAERFYLRNGYVPDGTSGDTGPIWFHRPMFRMVRRP